MYVHKHLLRRPFAVGRLAVHPALAGEDGAGAGQRLLQARRFHDQRRSGREPGPQEGDEPRPCATRSAGTCFSPSPSALARVYETRNEPATPANVRPTPTISWWRAKTSAIAPSMKPSLTLSVVESRNAPNGVPFPDIRE